MNNFNDLFLEANNYYKEGVYGLVITKLDEAEKLYSNIENNKFSLEDLYIFRGGAFILCLKNTKVPGSISKML